MTVKRDNLIQIGNKLYSKAKVHILATEKKTNGMICKDISDLYFTSDEEIKEGDWFHELNTPFIKKATKHTLTIIKDGIHGKNWKKIIATINQSLKIECDECKRINKLKSQELLYKNQHYTCSCQSLPQPSNNFMDVFIKEYNKDNIIEDILVEYIKQNKELDYDPAYYGLNSHKLKTDKNNCISIKKVSEFTAYDFTIEIWPFVQELFEKEGWKENSQLINDCPLEREFNGSAYFVRKTWLEQNK